MEYHALLVGLCYELFDYLKVELEKAAIGVTYALTAADGVRLFLQNRYDLVLMDLRAVREGNRIELLDALRRAKATPILVLTDGNSDEYAARLIDYGVDYCIPHAAAPLLIAKHGFSLVRRYTAYNRYDTPERVDAAPFAVGDIFIDPLRRTVQARYEPVNLHPREFSLLLYFMRNPGIVLTPSQICDGAWDKEGCGSKAVSGPVALLRKAVEPEPERPIYIETVRGIGYRFTGHKSETCDF